MVKFLSSLLSILISVPIILGIVLLLATIIAPFLMVISLVWIILLPFICLVHMFGDLFGSIRNIWKSKNTESTKHDDDVDYYRDYTVLDDGTIDMHISAK